MRVAAVLSLSLIAPLLAVSQTAQPPTKSELIGLLTCDPSLLPDRLIAIAESSMLRQLEDGSLELTRSVDGHGICIEKAMVIAAFGVLGVIGQACDGKAGALLTAFKRGFPDTPASLPAGYLFMGKSGNGEATVFRGSSTPPPRPDVTSDTISYSCAQQRGGAQ